jgi:uncharacterized membrane protein
MNAAAALAAIAALIFFAPLIGVLFGAFAGWVVGLFFTETIIGFFARAGFDVAGFAVWQIGAALGFVGAFFKATQTSATK